jgi:polyisoprenyl-phosphate glycosyltransferase
MKGKKDIHISVVIPVYGCSTALVELYLRLEKTLKETNRNYEIIMINDSSPDNAWETISDLCKRDKRICGINLSRNFGQHYAITAGLEYATGDWIVVMDCDLQDRPEEILKLYEKAKEGFDIVLGQRAHRKDKFIKRLFSKLFYWVFSYLTDTKLDSSIANFGIYSNKAISAVLSMKDNIRYFPTLILWVGYKKIAIKVDHDRRYEGKSTYSISRLFQLAFNNIIAFSDKPLRITIRLGFIMSFMSFIVGIIYLTRYISGAITVSGYTSLIISIWFLSGVIISILGLLGIYIGKVFDKVKDRPVFIIDKTINLND